MMHSLKTLKTMSPAKSNIANRPWPTSSRAAALATGPVTTASARSNRIRRCRRRGAGVVAESPRRIRASSRDSGLRFRGVRVEGSAIGIAIRPERAPTASAETLDGSCESDEWSSSCRCVARKSGQGRLALRQHQRKSRRVRSVTRTRPSQRFEFGRFHEHHEPAEGASLRERCPSRSTIFRVSRLAPSAFRCVRSLKSSA